MLRPRKTSKKDDKKKETAAKPVDLNNATQKEIESLKGIGAAKAKKIIANRPYKSVDDLSKAGLSKKEIDALKSNVVVVPLLRQKQMPRHSQHRLPSS